MTCPNCQQPLAVQHLRDNLACKAAVAKLVKAPEEPQETRTMRSIYALSCRATWPPAQAGGRHKKPTRCARCGALLPSARDAWMHCRKPK